MSTPMTQAQLITAATNKQQNKQVIAQSYLLLKDAAQFDAVFALLNNEINKNDLADTLKRQHQLGLSDIEYAEVEKIMQCATATDEEKKLALKEFLYKRFKAEVQDYITLKNLTEDTKKLNKNKTTPSQLPAQFTKLLGKLNDINPFEENEFNDVMATIQNDPALTSFLTERISRAGAGAPAASPAADPTVTIGNKFFREYQDRGQPIIGNPFLEDLEKKATEAGLIRIKDEKTNEWVMKPEPSRAAYSFIEKRENYKPSGQASATAINLIVARDIGFDSNQVVAFVNGNDAKIKSANGAYERENPCLIKFTDGKTVYRLLAKVENGRIVPYKIKEDEYDDWVNKSGSDLKAFAVKSMSGQDCACKLKDDPTRTAADAFAEMFVELADLNMNNVHTNIQAPKVQPDGPGAGVMVASKPPTALSSRTI